MDRAQARAACRRIVQRVGAGPGEDIPVFFDDDKAALAALCREEGQALGASIYLCQLPAPAGKRYPAWLLDLLAERAREGPAILLVGVPLYRGGALEAIGRPSQGVASRSPRFFCDWVLPAESFARVYSADPVEVECYRQALLHGLVADADVRVTTAAGTDMTLRSRDWCALSEGEVYTAPLEDAAEGVVVYDASLYWGRPEHPVRVMFERGRVVAVECAEPESEQCQMFLRDTRRDEGAPVLAELGIGINPHADPFGHGMEAEMAQGTCHFDLGNNLPFGGANRSSGHYGGTLYHPTLTVNGRNLMVEGRLLSLDNGAD